MTDGSKNNIIIAIGLVMIAITGIASYYLYAIAGDIADLKSPKKTKTTNNQYFEYKCMRFYIFTDGEMLYLNKITKDGWDIYNIVGPVVRDADRSRGGEGHIYVVLRRNKQL